MLLAMKEIVDEAYKGGYAVPAVPCWNDLFVRGVMEAADKTSSPVIFLSHNFSEAKDFHATIEKLALQTDIPVAICLDHSSTFKDSIWGIRNGCTAIMADRSMAPFEQNVAEVSELAKIAHACEISIEGELGHVGWGDNYAHDGSSMLTDPEDAKKYFDLTEVDALAVAVGTAHGVYTTGTPHIDFDRLRDINAACGRPLVLHGGSGSGDDNISKACTMGITKVNIVTDFFVHMNQYMINKNLVDNDLKFYLKEVQKSITEFAVHTFELTGCIGKAKDRKPASAPPANDPFSARDLK